MEVYLTGVVLLAWQKNRAKLSEKHQISNHVNLVVVASTEVFVWTQRSRQRPKNSGESCFFSDVLTENFSTEITYVV